MMLRKTLLTLLVPLVAALVVTTSAPAGAARPEPAAHRALGIPRTYDAAVQHFEQAKGEVLPLKRFQSPSGNIYCAMAIAHFPKACEIYQGAVKDPAACAGNPASKYVGRLQFVGGRAVAVCTAVNPGLTSLLAVPS